VAFSVIPGSMSYILAIRQVREQAWHKARTYDAILPGCFLLCVPYDILSRHPSEDLQGRL